MYQAAYILTASAGNTYAEMTLISALSLKITNPALPVTLVCDAQSADYLHRSCRNLLDTVDDLKVVETPDGCAIFRHRWIKTQLGLILPGDMLFLDSDTLIRGSLSAIPEQVRRLGGVLNHNGATTTDQIWDDDRKNLLDMGWSDQFKAYLNSGVWMSRKCDEMDRFFKTWHETWLQSVEATGRLRDQPSFNRATTDLKIDLTILPRSYNEQLAVEWRHAPSAMIWHFFSSHPMTSNSFMVLVNAARVDSLKSLRAQVGKAIRAAAPWPNIDPLAVRLSHLVTNQNEPGTAARLWLEGRRTESTRSLLAAPIRCIREILGQPDTKGRSNTPRPK